MHFQIMGNIAEVETIATSSGIRELSRLRSGTDVVGGGNVKELQMFG